MGLIPRSSASNSKIHERNNTICEGGIMTIDTVVERIAGCGNLLDNLRLLRNIDSWQTAREVFTAWQAGAPVEGVNTANMAVYRLDNDNVVFNLLEKSGNLFIDDNFREGAYNGIVSNEFFFPPDQMKSHILSAITAGQSATINYSGLRIKIKQCGQNYGYVEVGEENTDEEKKLFSAVYGVENPGIGKRVYLLREDVVQEQLKHRTTDLVARACYFDTNQNFNAGDRSINNYGSAVRGVRCVENTKKSDPLRNAYNTVLDGVNALSDTEIYDLYAALQPRVMASAKKQMK